MAECLFGAPRYWRRVGEAGGRRGMVCDDLMSSANHNMAGGELGIKADNEEAG